MSTKDISRFLFQPRKRYSSVRMQQGRAILDSDYNESERIDDEEARRTLIDLICSNGTPNQGFRVGNVQGAEVEIPTANPAASLLSPEAGRVAAADVDIPLPTL